MYYTKYLVAGIVLSLVSVSANVSAETGSMMPTTTGATTVSAPVTTTGTTVSPTSMTTSLEVKGAPRLVKKTADSVVIEWDAVPSASAYIVKYSKASVANSKDPNAQYDNETDQITTTGSTITKLSSTNEKLASATPYYFSVVAIDKEGKESDTFSDELMVTTESSTVAASTGATTSSSTGTVSPTTTVPLAIKDLIVSDDKTLSLSFNTNLSSDPVKVKITKTSDSSDIPVASIAQDPVNPAAVVITTLATISPSSSYTIAVLSAKDTLGNTIQEGVNGLKEFTTVETLKASADSTPILAAAGTDTGATLTGALTPEAATKVATGAKENVIVFAALLLSLGIVAIYRRKLI